MKNKSLIILLVLVILLSILKFVPFGIVDHTLEHPLLKVKIPSLSNRVEIWGNDSGEVSLTFDSFSSKYVLEKELKDIIESYSKVECRGKTYYYDQKNNVTIKEYSIKRDLLFNKYTISYYNGKYTEEECNQ